ncbi:MAG: hypothetical protein RLY35_1114 [Bacteroidota bacterium]
MKKGLFILGAGLMLMASCGRYEEGPGFSLRSKKSRLAGDWKIKEITVNGSTTDAGEPTLPSGYDIRLSFEKSGSGVMKEIFPGETTMESSNFTWEFKDDSLIMKDADGYRDAMRIVRLSNKDLWLDYTYQSEVTQYKFEF